jgi:hypothetical protein
MCIRLIKKRFTGPFRFTNKIIPCLLIATLKQIFTINIIQQDGGIKFNNINVIY